MQPTEPSLFSLLSARTRWLGERQAVLAHNVANADTPNFRPHDIEDFSSALSRMVPEPVRPPLVRTDVAHLAAPARTGGPNTVDAQAFEIAPDGNAVVLAEQMSKLSSTQLDYQMVTGIYGKQVGMMKMALGGPAS